MDFVGHVKKLDDDDDDNATDIGNDRSMFVLIILKKNQRNKINIFSRKCNSIIKDGKLSTSKS